MEQVPSVPIIDVSGEVDESEVPLDEVQSQFFLLREDGGVGCRFCIDFVTKEQTRPLYPLRDHVHSVHFNICPYRCHDCSFKTSSYRLSFTHAEAMGHKRNIMQRSQNVIVAKSAKDVSTKAIDVVKRPSRKRKSNPLGEDCRRPSDEPFFDAVECPEDQHPQRVPPTPSPESVVPIEDVEVIKPSKETKDSNSNLNSEHTPYVVPSFLPTPPLTPKIENEYFRFDIEGFLRCSQCEFRVHNASQDGPGPKRTLLEHVYAAHIENLPWTCSDCQFSTKFRSNLLRHCRKMSHLANDESYAPPGDADPAKRVIASSAKRVKWAGGDANGYRSKKGLKPEHGYSIPKVTPQQRQSNLDEGSVVKHEGGMTPEVVRRKYVLTEDCSAKCLICNFVIRKTTRVSDPSTFMLSHVSAHLGRDDIIKTVYWI